jgi:Trpc4-associated protein
VQFLRLVHNFCDRDCENNNEQKRLMLSEDERRALDSWDPLSSQPLTVDPACPKGLLTKIVEVLMKEKSDSVYRFWLASCVESFLRGSSPREQLFVAQTGLLRHLLGEVLSEVRGEP